MQRETEMEVTPTVKFDKRFVTKLVPAGKEGLLEARRMFPENATVREMRFHSTAALGMIMVMTDGVASAFGDKVAEDLFVDGVYKGETLFGVRLGFSKDIELDDCHLYSDGKILAKLTFSD